MQKSTIICHSKSMVAAFIVTMPGVTQHHKRLIKEYLLSLGLTDIMFFLTFTRVSMIPIKASYLLPVDHFCILPPYTFLTSATPDPDIVHNTEPLP